MHIRRNNRIFNNPNGRPDPMILPVNGTAIIIITQWDALCYLYTINLYFQKTKKRKNRKKYLRQVRSLFRHQDQLCQWITIMENSRRRQPFTVNVSWKSNQQKITNHAFGASITAHDPDDRKELCKYRQNNDQYILPRDLHANVIPKLTDWEFGNCSEMNAWTYLCRVGPDQQIKSRTISVHNRVITETCENCKAIQNWLMH